MRGVFATCGGNVDQRGDAFRLGQAVRGGNDGSEADGRGGFGLQGGEGGLSVQVVLLASGPRSGFRYARRASSGLQGLPALDTSASSRR